MDHSALIHSPAEGHLGRFWFGAVMSKTAVNIHVQGFVWMSVFNSVEQTPRSEAAGHGVRPGSPLRETARRQPCHLRPAAALGSPVVPPQPLTLVIPVGGSRDRSNLRFPNDDDVGHLCRYSLARCTCCSW